MKLRAHHLLCIRAFKGNGYSKRFIKNMKRIIKKLKNNEEIEIVKGVDDVCLACPEKYEHHCPSESKVKKIDSKVMLLLNLKFEKQHYIHIDKAILENLTKEIFNKICHDCEWKKSNLCTFEDIIKNFYE